LGLRRRMFIERDAGWVRRAFSRSASSVVARNECADFVTALFRTDLVRLCPRPRSLQSLLRSNTRCIDLRMRAYHREGWLARDTNVLSQLFDLSDTANRSPLGHDAQRNVSLRRPAQPSTDQRLSMMMSRLFAGSFWMTCCVLLHAVCKSSVRGCLRRWPITHTTSSYSNLVIGEGWRLPGAVEAVTGIRMCGRSSGYDVAFVNRHGSRQVGA
jgi:hypothetical protein